MTTPDGRLRRAAPLAEWARRYVPLEILSTVAALAGAAIAALFTTSAVAIAYAGAWAENVGYYGYAFAREMRWIERADRASGDCEARPWMARALGASKALLWEFGAAEVLDSFVVRPACMYAAVAVLGSLGAGIVVGKLAADLVFYAIAIAFYEMGKRRSGDRA